MPTRSHSFNLSLSSLVGLLAAIIIFTSCAGGLSGAAAYNEESYQAAMAFKGRAMNLMTMASTDYELQQKYVNEFKGDVSAQIEKEKLRERNQVLVNEWELLMNEEKNLLGGFFKRWQNEGKLSQAFINAAKKNISVAFDKIMDTETTKRKAATATSPNSGTTDE